MNEKEVILDRIKGCLTAVALSDAINNFEKATGKLFLLVRDKPGSQKKAAREHSFHRDVNSKNSLLPPSNMMRGLIDCMYALMMWKDDLLESGNYLDPGKYIDIAIDKSLWNYNFFTPFESRMCWSTAIAVGILGSWLFDFSEDINRDIKVIATNPLLKLHLDDDEDENKRLILGERTQCGIFSAVIRNLIIYQRQVETADYLMIVSECATRNLWGDETKAGSIGNEALFDFSKMSDSRYEYLSHMLEWEKNSIRTGSYYHGQMLYGGIRCSAILGCVNGYEAFPYKDALKHVKVMPEIEELMANIRTQYLNI